MKVYPGMQPAKTYLEGRVQPRLVHKASGQMFVLVRDDVKENGRLYIAPQGMITSMRSILPEEIAEYFEWYVEPSDRPKPDIVVETADQTSQPITEETVQENIKAKKKAGRPKGKKDSKPRTKKAK